MADTGFKYSGRREDRRFVTGQGRYTNDWNLEGQAHAAFRRADRAHAIIKSIDTDAAKRAPGVLAVLTGQDVAQAGFASVPPLQPPPGRGGMAILAPERPVLARERVRFVGEEVAVVVAETQAAARAAADLVYIDYGDLPVLIGVGRAMAPGAFQMHDNIPGNICFDFEYGDEKQAAAAFARAAGTVSVTAESPRVSPNPMEVRGALVSYDAANDAYDFYSPNQGGPAFAHELSVMSGIAHDKIRVRMLDVGGAFGARTAPFPEYPVLMLLA
jgi:carbon-monoxide dehydrogenase large subunit